MRASSSSRVFTVLVGSNVEYNYLVVDVCCLLRKYQLHVSALMAIFRLNELTKNIGSYIWQTTHCISITIN